MSFSAQAAMALEQRALTEEDLQDVLSLHLRCTQGMSAGMVRSESMTSLHRLLQRGKFLGLFHQKQLIAYGVIQQDLEAHERLPDSIPIDNLRPQGVLTGMAVAPEWRGLGLQRRLIMLRVAVPSAQTLLFSTAAPGNWYSWNNLLACGFHVRALDKTYAGSLRYLMVLEPLPESALYPDFSQEVHALDTQRQQTLLSQGWRGAQPGSHPEYIRYVPVHPDALRRSA